MIGMPEDVQPNKPADNLTPFERFERLAKQVALTEGRRRCASKEAARQTPAHTVSPRLLKEANTDGALAEPQELDRAEFRKLLEDRLRAALNMSVPEFLELFESGRLDPESPKVAQFAILLARTR